MIIVPREHQKQTKNPHRQHNLTYELTEKEGQDWKTVWQSILDWVDTLEVPQVLWLAHNGTSLDFRLLHRACLQSNLESPFSREDFIFGDTLRLCRYVRTDLVLNGISTMLLDYEIPVEERHTATGDVKALAAIIAVRLAEKAQDIIAYLLHFFKHPTY